MWMTASGALHVLILAAWWLAVPSAPAVYLPVGAGASPVRVILVAASTAEETSPKPEISLAADGIPAPDLSTKEPASSPAETTAAASSSPSGARLNRPAMARYSPAPQYPESARRQGQEGTVEMRVYIDDEGTVTRVELATSSGHELLDRSARQALKQWRFQPALQGGFATSSVERQRFVFRLQES